MKREIHTDRAPAAIGPYSQAVAVPANGELLFVSGQIPIDPKTGKLVDGGIEKQTQRVLDNLQAVLEASGCSWEHILRMDVFLISLKEDFPKVNELYAHRFSGTIPPARQTIEVSALPMGSRVEMSCIAVYPLRRT